MRLIRETHIDFVGMRRWAAVVSGALILIAITGVIIYATTSLTAHLALRKWHESALKRE